MRIVLFWIKMFFYFPYFLYTANKAEKLPFSERYDYLRKVMALVVKKLRIQVETIGVGNIPLENGFLLVGNHQGSSDAFVFLSACPIATTAISKKEGRKVPILGKWYEVMEVIFFDRNSLKDAARMTREVTARLKSGRNVQIFPEGTRSKSQTMNPFKPGSFKGAMIAHAPIVPFAMVNSYIPLDSKEKIKPVKVVFLQPLHYEEYQSYTSDELSKEVQKRIQEAIDCYA